jgi:hypothetical protein
MNRAGKLISVCPLILCLTALGQDIHIDVTSDGRGDSGYQTKWDSVQGRLLLFRDSSTPDVPSARIVEEDGISVPVFVLHDFRDAKFVDIWAAAATPEGGLVLSVILGFANRPQPKEIRTTPVPLKSLLLTYGKDGALKKVWNVAPYHHQALAVDADGDVFALGTRDAGKEGFPMIVKYSAKGEVLREFAPSSMFANGGKALDGTPLNGSPSLLIRKGMLVLWVPSTKEMFRFSLDGKLQRKSAIGNALDRLAAENKFAHATIAGIALADSGEFMAQVWLWPNEKNSEGVVEAMANVSSDGQKAALASPILTPGLSAQFLGISSDGKQVKMERAGKGQAIVRKE